MYTTKRYTAEISIEEYIKDYVNITEFLECCKVCPGYGNIWSCQPYDFDVEGYWCQYSKLELIAEKIIFDEDYAGKKFTDEEMKQIIKASIGVVKAGLTEELYRQEEKVQGSISLSAGSCELCKEGCTRPEGKPCRHPDRMRYSIESIGGNVGLTISRLMGIDIEWIEEGRLPASFVLVCGLLR